MIDYVRGTASDAEDGDGIATFKYNHVPTGFYTTDVEKITISGVEYLVDTPDNGRLIEWK